MTASKTSTTNPDPPTTCEQAPGDTRLAAERLAMDPRIQQAKQLIMEAVREHQRDMTQVRPADPQLAEDFKQQLAEFEQLRGGTLFFPYLSSGLGNGPFVQLADGSVKLDMITGIGVHGLGHSDPRLIEAGIDAVLCDTVMQGNLQQNQPSVDFTRLLVDLATESGADLQHCVLTTSGAMANENALKLAMQKNHPATRIFAFDNCFCGRTLALSSMTDRPGYRTGLPLTVTVDYLPFYDHRDPAGSLQRTMEIFESQVARYPGRHALVWLELIAGEGGYYPGSAEYFETLCSRARALGIAVICDEVQTFARTNRPFAFQHFGLDSLVDIVTVGKITQVCATLFTPAYQPKPGLISQTFTGNSSSILAGLRIVRELIAGGHFHPEPDRSKNFQLHQLLVDGLQAIQRKYPGSLQGPYGLGGMVGFTPFDGSAAVAKDMTMRLYQAGLIGFTAGEDPTRIRFLMPLGTIQPKHIEMACQILEQVVAQMVSARESAKE